MNDLARLLNTTMNSNTTTLGTCSDRLTACIISWIIAGGALGIVVPVLAIPICCYVCFLLNFPCIVLAAIGLVGCMNAGIEAGFDTARLIRFAARHNCLSLLQLASNFGLSCQFGERWHGKAPIELAIANGHLSIVKYLVAQCGVALRARDQNGNTPLHHALMGTKKKKRTAYLQIARYLLSKDRLLFTIENNAKKTPFDIILEKWQRLIPAVIQPNSFYGFAYAGAIARLNELYKTAPIDATTNSYIEKLLPQNIGPVKGASIESQYGCSQIVTKNQQYMTSNLCHRARAKRRPYDLKIYFK